MRVPEKYEWVQYNLCTAIKKEKSKIMINVYTTQTCISNDRLHLCFAVNEPVGVTFRWTGWNCSDRIAWYYYS